MKTRGKSLKLLIPVAEIVIIASLLISFVFVFINARGEGDVFDISKGWNISIDGTEYEDVDVSTFMLPRHVNDVHEIDMYYQLSDDMKYGTTLRVYTRLSFIEVSLGEELLYFSGIEEQNPNGFVGMGYHFIQIPNKANSDVIHIRVVALEKNALVGIPKVSLTSTDVAYTYFVDENALGIFVSCFIFALGMVLTLISVLYTYLNFDYFRLFLVGSFAFCSGFWSLCSQKALQLFNVSLSANSSMEYFLLEMTFLPLIGYDLMVREDRTKNEKLALRVLLFITLVYDMIAAVLHFTDTLHYSQFVFVFYIIALVDCIGMLFIGVKTEKQMSRSEKTFHYALCIMGLFGFWRIIDYVFGNFLVRGIARAEENLFPIFLLFFVLSMLVSYLFHLYDMVLTQAQEEALTVLAYKDSLTGLYNRAMSEDIFEQLNEKEQTNYLFIDFDLNGLKKANDELGHGKGDLLISGFAKVLEETFSTYGKNMRMGGDEFLTIIEAKELPNVDILMQNYDENREKVSKEIGIEVSASYGIAYSSEVFEPEAEQVFRLADERMYEMKRKSKRARG
ncbi:MAG: GGDEF domain-containing protein [Lachnospiraceae bacterium]|nr:GGDEF domain-containing protein [Lachnospiraceae bacterium]